MVSDMKERIIVLGRYNEDLEQCQKLALETADIPLEHLGRSYQVASEFTKYPQKLHLLKSYKSRIIPEANNQKKLATKKWIRTDIVMGASAHQKERTHKWYIYQMQKGIIPRTAEQMKRFGITANELKQTEK